MTPKIIITYILGNCLLLASSIHAQEATYYGEFEEIAPTQITPQGWLKEYLLRQQSGLTGNPKKQGFPMNSTLWNGVILQDDKGNNVSDSWWPYEQTGYYLDGMVRLALLINDEKLLKTYIENSDWIINNPTKEGLIGTALYTNPSHWPNGVFFKSVIPYYMSTGDQKVLDAWYKHYTSATVKDIGENFRHTTNIEGLLRVYGWTGDEKLKKKAVDAYDLFNQTTNINKLNFPTLSSNDKIVMHGVTYSEELKLPVILYIYTGDQKYLKGAEHAIHIVEKDHLCDSGVPSSTEYLCGKDAIQSHETCVTADFTWTLGYYLMATGNPKYADMIEKAVFNAGPGAMTKDFKQVQYMSADNQVNCTQTSNHNKYSTGNEWLAYRPDQEPDCCPGNTHRIMPNFATRMWMKNAQDQSPVAVFYGPSKVNFTVRQEGKEIPITIQEKTNYPFSDTIEFTFETNNPVTMPFSFRIPSWCATPELKVNGKKTEFTNNKGAYATLKRIFKKGDTLTLTLPMDVKLNRFQNSLSLERGPLLYSYSVPAHVAVNKEHTVHEDFPALDLTPAGDWNYALALDESNFKDKVTVHQAKDQSVYPYEGGKGSPSLTVPVRKVKNYTLTEKGFTPFIPVAYELEEKTSTIELIPYGATTLRITHFPENKEHTLIPIENWQISPTFAFDKKQPITQQKFSPELEKSTEWKTLTPDKKDGFVRLDQLLKETDKLVYAKATLEANADQKATLAINAKDAAQIWLNGKQVHETRQPNDLEFQAADLIPVSLKKGKNEVMIKVSRYGPVYQYPDGWGFRIKCIEEKK